MASVSLRALSLTHLFFADDAIIVAKANLEEVYQVVAILNSFTVVFGQRINLQKSDLICGKNVPDDIKVVLSHTLRIPLWASPGKYLGIPAEWGTSTGQALLWIKERVLPKLDGWKENYLSQGDKEVLIKSVIQAIPSYVMAIVSSS